MHVIIVYDVPAKRTEKYKKLLRKYLDHNQASVFMGDIGQGKYCQLENEIENLHIKDDHIIIYKLNYNYDKIEFCQSTKTTINGDSI